jgi:ATP-dependent Clp protease ATP-binding subunit ClpB
VVKHEYVVVSRGFWSIDELHTLFGSGKAEGNIDTSTRYITDRFLPDKTIDLADEAISALRLQQDSKPDAIRKFDREITTLQSNSSGFEKRWNMEKDREEVENIKRTKEELERSRLELEQV